MHKIDEKSSLMSSETNCSSLKFLVALIFKNEHRFFITSRAAAVSAFSEQKASYSSRRFHYCDLMATNKSIFAALSPMWMKNYSMFFYHARTSAPMTAHPSSITFGCVFITLHLMSLLLFAVFFSILSRCAVICEIVNYLAHSLLVFILITDNQCRVTEVTQKIHRMTKKTCWLQKLLEMCWNRMRKTRAFGTLSRG